MYTISALWTHAREQLDITTVIFSNRSYAILNMELERTGAPAAGQSARSLLDLSRPGLSFTALAEGMGVPGQQGADRARVRRATAPRARRARPAPHRGRDPAVQLSGPQGRGPARAQPAGPDACSGTGRPPR